MTLSEEKKLSPVLIADDDEFFRVALHNVLQDQIGLKNITQCSSLDDAVAALTRRPRITLGLFDLNMVDMDNWVDLQALREQYPDMRLIVVSGSKRCEDILMALSIGAHGYIHKGSGVGELSRAIKLICDGDVYVPPFLPDAAAKRAPMEFVLHSEGSQPDKGATEGNGLRSADTPSTAPHIGDISAIRCTPRQRQIIELLIKGYSNKEMARELDLSGGTIKFHMSAVLRLMGTNSRTSAATRAMAMLEAEKKENLNLIEH